MRKQTVKSIQKAARALSAVIVGIEKDMSDANVTMLEDMTGVEQSKFLSLHRQWMRIYIAKNLVRDVLELET